MAKGYEQAVRVARRTKHCYGCDGVIASGTRFLDYTATPRHDMNQTGKWLHAAFCHGCSEFSPEWTLGAGPISSGEAADPLTRTLRTIVEATGE